ncbi:MAG: permease [Candidatus Cloacimonetes bacterium]|nr:permease [Candidatus Cloacimonadota bacterium]
MDWKQEWKTLLIMAAVFLGAYFMPVGTARFDFAFREGLFLLKDYAREHILLCLIPAFFIAGAISVFISQGAVMKYLGSKAKKVIAYSVASVSGSILAVCSCTVLPLFSGIYKRGAGLGPATTFLYSGPAINIMAIILTARVLGMELGVARAVGAILFSIIIGLMMQLIFRKEKTEEGGFVMPENEKPLWQNVSLMVLLVLILVAVNWGKPVDDVGVWSFIYQIKWLITAGLALMLGVVLIKYFAMKLWKIGVSAGITLLFAVILPQFPTIAFAAAFISLSFFISRKEDELGDWFLATWDFAKQILPLLLFGVLIAGMLLGRPEEEGLIPSQWVYAAVGGNSLGANFFAAIAGAFMYFATLTEVPILQGLIGNGMGKGPALALLLAGPALSLPNMLVIRSVLGTKKTLVFVTLVVVMSTIAGVVYGYLF